MGWAGLVRRVRRRRQEGSRGAVLVEFVLIAPVFALLVAGVLEFGLAFRDSMTVSNALRSGARVGSNAGRERLADYTILKSVEAAMKEVPTSRVDPGRRLQGQHLQLERARLVPDRHRHRQPRRGQPLQHVLGR